MSWAGWADYKPAGPSGAASKRRHKYGAEAVIQHGIRFHSKREAARYEQLMDLVRQGLVRKLDLQVRFGLHVVGGLSALIVPIGTYVADFVYEERAERDSDAWRQVVEDVKGVRTELYKWKKRHFEAEYALAIRET